MSYRMDLEERFEAIAARLERVEKINRLMKVWGAIAIATLIAAGPFASNVMAKAKPKAVTASAFNLESNGEIVATLGILDGKPNLVFYDSTGKTVVDVGINGAALPTGHAAGLAVLDGNEDIPGTGKVRTSVGVTPSGPLAGVGEGTFDGNGVLRSSVGSAVDGSSAGVGFLDATGVTRTGLTYDPATNFTGFFSDDPSTKTRSAVGSGVDGTFSGSFIYDAAGDLRDQTIYVPSANFNGTQSQDGAGHPLASVGNFLVDDAPHLIQANESFMTLSDTSLPRIFEFQNSTNQGGLDYNPGAFPTPDDGNGWGSP
ncbi:MAG: hypothetical protein WBQ86_02550 [Candidatus Binatus sp.]